MREIIGEELIIKNAQDEPDTKATIIHKNTLNYDPKISIIIPVYNVEKYLKECLDSVINQTFRDIEIICIDDGSKDASLEILKEYAQQDIRISILTQQNNGPGAARNAGIQLARGEYLHFIDSDDFIDKNIYTKSIPFIKSKNLDIFMFGYLNYTSSELSESFTKDIFKKFNHKHIHTSDLIVHFFLGVWNKIYKTSFIKNNNIKFPTTVRIAEDCIFGTTCALHNPKFKYTTECYYFYRNDNNTSITNNYNKAIIDEINAHSYISKQPIYKKANKKIQKAIDLRTANGLIYQCSRLKNKITEKDKINNYLNFLYKKYGNSIKKKSSYKTLKQIINKKIPVVIASDDAYAVATATCIYSILEKTKAYIDIYILSDNISQKKLKKIRQSISKFSNYTLSIINMNEFNIKQFPNFSRFKVSCFSRYFIPQICSQYDKVIYSDADVIFMDDIEKYYDIDIQTYGIGATPEELGKTLDGEYNHSYRKKLFGISKEHQYFANGNLIINCKYWRENKITEKLIKKTHEITDKLICPDLDVMNIIFENNYKKLHFKYCVCTHRYEDCAGNIEMINGYAKPFIIHYSGCIKPWISSNIIFHKEYTNILKKTKFKSYYYKQIYNKFLQNIFSIKNVSTHKIINILGLKIKLKNKYLVQQEQIKQLEYKINNLNYLINTQNKVLEQYETLFKDLVKQEDILGITELAMIKTKYNWDNIFIPNIKNNEETIKALINSENSIIRFGDGEFLLMTGQDNMFEKSNINLQEQLTKIFYEDNENLLIGSVEPYYEYSMNLRKFDSTYIYKWLPKWNKKTSKFYNPNKTYYSSFLSQTYATYETYPFEEHYNTLKQIWNNRNITIICGNRVYNNIEYNIFDNAKTINYIYGPTTAAFEKYEEIKQNIEQVSKECILVFALGPCGKILAYEMFKQGYRVLDLGHLIKDYDFYKKSHTMSKEEWETNRARFFKND